MENVIVETRKRVCSGCKEEKLLSEFRRDKYGKDGYGRGCKDCCNKSFKKWYHENPELAKKMRDSKREYRKEYYTSSKGSDVNRKSHLKNKYNCTLEDYNNLFESQNGVCAICANSAETKSKRVKNLNVDHDHNTNNIRGLLCTPCNRALGMFEDDIEILKKAVEYLSKYKNI